MPRYDAINFGEYYSVKKSGTCWPGGYVHRATAPSKPPNFRPPHRTVKGKRYGRLSQLPPEASTATDSHPLITPTLKGGYRPGSECRSDGQCPESANVT